MFVKSKSPTPGYVRITFELPACIWADKIYLTGDFNRWNQKSIPMLQGRDGVWRATLDLPVGTKHEFRYLVDGEWTTDFHADELSTNAYGSQNSLVKADYQVTTIRHRNIGNAAQMAREKTQSSQYRLITEHISSDRDENMIFPVALPKRERPYFHAEPG